LVNARIRGGKDRVDKTLSACRPDRGIEVADRLAQDGIGGDIPLLGAQELFVLRLHLAMVRITLIGESNPSPGVDENHRLGVP
jgi:hypothetical protein